MTEIKKGDLITNKITGQQMTVDKLANDGIGPLARGNIYSNRKLLYEGWYDPTRDVKRFAPQPPSRKGK